MIAFVPAKRQSNRLYNVSEQMCVIVVYIISIQASLSSFCATGKSECSQKVQIQASLEKQKCQRLLFEHYRNEPTGHHVPTQYC